MATIIHFVNSENLQWYSLIIGVASGVVVSVVAVLVAQVFENRRWNLQQVSLADVARADRLREIYGRMAQASVTLNNVRVQRVFVMRDEPIEQRNERHLRNVREAIDHVAELGGQILIESSASAVAESYSHVASSIDAYLVAERDEPPGSPRAELLRELADKISNETESVIRLATEHLDSLNKPRRATILHSLIRE